MAEYNCRAGDGRLEPNEIVVEAALDEPVGNQDEGDARHFEMGVFHARCLTPDAWTWREVKRGRLGELRPDAT